MTPRILAMAATLALTAPGTAIPPVTPVRVLAPFHAPETAFSPGHRGIDLVAHLGQVVRSPIEGVVGFRASVAGRPIITVIDGERVFSLEPVEGQVPLGATVAAGQPIGVVGIGGHCSLRCVHIGLRVAGEYVVPLRLHARLLP